jgi:hypothetical protein
MHFNLDYSPGKQFLFESGYDLRIATYFSPEGDDLSEYPEIRSKYQRAIGLQNLELKLSKLSRRRDVQESLQQMYFDIRSGKRADNQASEYLHNILIDDIFDAARQIAWTTIIDDPVIAKLQQERNKKALNKRNQYMSAQTILNMYK